MKIIKLDLKSFVKRIIKSKNLILFDCNRYTNKKKKVKIVKGNYGGCRIDRIRDRNRITNALGFKECSGISVMSCDDIKNTGGTFLADILTNYGKEYYFIENGEILSFEIDIKIESVEGYMGFDGVKHFDKVK